MPAPAALVLPGWDGQWVLEIADGEGADASGRHVMPAEGRAVSVGPSPARACASADLSTEPSLLVPALREFGPALYAPLIAGEDHVGVLMLLRHVGEREFTDADLATAADLRRSGRPGAAAGRGRRRGEEAELLEDRARIARDLHDLVVQELFAMGMRLSRLRDGLDPGVVADIDSSLESLDRVVRQIRSTIRALRDPDERPGSSTGCTARRPAPTPSLGFHADVQVDTGDGTDEHCPAGARRRRGRRGPRGSVERGPARARHHGHRAGGADARPWSASRSATTASACREHRPGAAAWTTSAERARRHGGTCSAEPRPGGGTTLHWQILLQS